MKSIEQLRKQVTVLPCRFDSFGGAEQIPNTSESDLSIYGGLPVSYAEEPGQGHEGKWVLRRDINSLGCLASDELFFKQNGGVHTFESDTLWASGTETYVSSITTNGTSPRTYVRNASFDVPASSSASQNYYGWTDNGDVVYTTLLSNLQSSPLFSLETGVQYVFDPEGRTVSAYTPGDSSDPNNIVPATITVGMAECTRDEDSDVQIGGETAYYGWSGGFLTTNDTESVVGEPVYITEQTGVVATRTGEVIGSFTEDYVGGGYPKDAVLEFAIKKTDLSANTGDGDSDIMPWSLKVMSVVPGTTVDFIADETALLTEKNWKIVEPEKDFDTELAICQVDWSGVSKVSGRFYAYDKKTSKPYGYFAKDGGASLIADLGIASVLIALKDEDEVEGY